MVLKVPSVFASKIPEGEERLKLIEEIKVPGIHQWDIIPGIQWTKVHYLTKNHPADLGPNKNTHVYTFGFSVDPFLFLGGVQSFQGKSKNECSQVRSGALVTFCEDRIIIRSGSKPVAVAILQSTWEK